MRHAELIDGVGDNLLTRPLSLPAIRVNWPLLATVTIWAWFVWLRVGMLFVAPITYPDSAGYLAPNNHTDLRTVPLLLDLLGHNLPLTVAVQTIIGALSWAALAYSLSLHIHEWRGKISAVALVLAIANTQPVAVWDSMILTESLTLSGFALLTAGALLLARQWSWWVCAAIVAVSPLWAGCRDTNAYLLAMVAMVLLGGVAVRKLPTRYMIIAVSFLVSFAAISRTADRDKRWLMPFYNNVTQRISYDAEGMTLMRRHGMKVSWTAPVMAQQGRWGRGIDGSADLAPFRQWASIHGKETLTAYIVADPDRSAMAPLRDLHLILRGPFMARGDKLSFYLFPTSIIVTTLGLLVVLGLAWFLRRHFTPAWCVPLGMIALSYSLLCVTWWGDAMEVERHAVLPVLMLRVGMWLMVVLSIDSNTLKSK